MTDEVEDLLDNSELDAAAVEETEIEQDSAQAEAVESRKPSYRIAKMKAKEQGRREMADELRAELAALKAEMASMRAPAPAQQAQQAFNPAMPMDEEQIAQRAAAILSRQHYDAAVAGVRNEYESLLTKVAASNPDVKDSLDVVSWDEPFMDLVAANILRSGIDNPEDVIAALIDDPSSITTLANDMNASKKRGEAALRKYAQRLKQTTATINRARNNQIPTPSGQVRSNPSGAYNDEESIEDMRNDPFFQ